MLNCQRVSAMRVLATLSCKDTFTYWFFAKQTCGRQRRLENFADIIMNSLMLCMGTSFFIDLYIYISGGLQHHVKPCHS
jgi:hypothetical protein